MLGEHDATKLHSLLITSNSMEIANRGHLASTDAVPVSLREDGVPTLSIVTEEKNLYDKREGLLRHRQGRGREWERPALVSYFEKGELRYEAPVGLRLHGGKSRKSIVPSLQLAFRRSYAGAPRSPEGVFFAGSSQPYQRLVLASTLKEQRFLNPLALRIAEYAGCITSKSQPVRLLLNGEPMETGYFLLEHQSREFLRNRFGHDDFEWHRLKGKSPKSEAFDNLNRWAKRAPAPLLMREVAAHFSIEDICAWVLAISWCGTTDNDQGGYFLDRRDPSAIWRSVAWDMDGSFNHGEAGGNPDVQFERVKGIRGRLFERLCAEDPEFPVHFREYATRFFAEVLPPSKLRALIDEYRAIAITDPFANDLERHRSSLDNTEEYLNGRARRYPTEFDQYVAKLADERKKRHH